MKAFDDLITGVTRLRRQADQGRVLVAVLRTYLDESGTHAGAGLACSAGYIFSHGGSEEFGSEWNAFLVTKGLSKFHATELCSRPDAALIFNSLRDITKRTSEKGFIRFILADDLHLINQQPEFTRFTGSGYTLLTLSCMQHIANYAKSKGDEVWYFIESGDGNEKEFRRVLRQIEDSPDLKSEYAYYAGELLPKKDAIQLQAADLAAWSLSRVVRDMWIPGFEHWHNWKDWYARDHDLTGFTQLSAQIRSLVNRFAGFEEME